MASKAIYPIVAVIGIAAASGAAWWVQNKNTTAKDVNAVGANASIGASTSAAGAGQGGAPNAPRAISVEAVKVEKVSIRDDAQAVGTLRSRQSVMLRPEVAGRVSQLGFADGARVRRGQMMVQLDDTLQRAEIKQMLAQVAIARSNHRRNQDLVAQNFLAKRVLDESDSALQVAEAQLALSCARLDRMRVLAPFDGTVGMRNINLGDYVRDGADMIDLEDIGKLYVDFRLPERYQSKIRQGQTVELQLDAFPNRKFSASIEAIDPLIDANGRSVGVRAIMPNTAGVPIPLPPLPGTNAPAAAKNPINRPKSAVATKPTPSGSSDVTAIASNKSSIAPNSQGRHRTGNSGLPESAALGVRGALNNGVSSSDKIGSPAKGVERATTFGAGSQPGVSACAALSNVSNAANSITNANANKPALVQVMAPNVPPIMGPLRPGMFARVTTVFAIKNEALTIPEEAIVPQAGRQYVIKVIDPGLLPPAAKASAPAWPAGTQTVSQRVEVKLGVRRPGRVEVVEGLFDADTVITAGQQRIQRDGTPLRVLDIGRPPPASSGGAPPPGQGGTPVAGSNASPTAASTIPSTPSTVPSNGANVPSPTAAPTKTVPNPPSAQIMQPTTNVAPTATGTALPPAAGTPANALAPPPVTPAIPTAGTHVNNTTAAPAR